jgi:glucosamine--fructose-6-phosphate aminotransferase (isomerizing)
MCGIVGCIVAKGNAAPIIFESLKRLEYRGYDSAGIATISDGKLLIKKDAGKLSEIDARLDLKGMPGQIGIGHTRWATHGAPSQVNAHPHTDGSGTIAVVHNGIIENFMELKRELMELRHSFKSKTDTEVVAHLIQEMMNRGLDILTATAEALRKVKGSYSLAIIYSGSPDRIILARNESPLIIGVGEGYMFAASDAAAFLPYTDKAVYLENGEIAVLRLDGYEIYKIEDLRAVNRSHVVLKWTVEEAQKAGFPHYTLKEIHEQGQAVREALRVQLTYADLLVELLDRGRDVFLLGAGTSYHACLAGSYIFSKLARLSAYPVIASEFVENYGSSIGVDTVILAVSQSGETIDVLNALEYARLRAATILGLTNVVGSTLTRISRAYVLQNSGPEIGVAATKTFTSQLTVLMFLALRLARKRGKVSQAEMDSLQEDLSSLPGLVSLVIKESEPIVKGVAKKLSSARLLLFLGRGISYATALEGRLKVMELSYIPCIAYPAGESKHGPISIVEEGLPVFFVAPRDETRRYIIGNLMEMKARGAMTVVTGERDDRELQELADIYIPMPPINPLLSPILYTIPYQLLAYYLALERGNDPDKPRNLAKSVTVL